MATEQVGARFSQSNILHASSATECEFNDDGNILVILWNVIPATECAISSAGCDFSDRNRFVRQNALCPTTETTATSIRAEGDISDNERFPRRNVQSI